MSLTDQAAPSHSTKNERRGVPSPSSRPRETGQQQPRMVRLTVSLPGDLVNRLRDAVYWSPSLKLVWLIAQSLRTSLTEMESLASRSLPKTKERAPRRATSIAWTDNERISSCQAHRHWGQPVRLRWITQAILVAQPSIEWYTSE